MEYPREFLECSDVAPYKEGRQPIVCMPEVSYVP